MNQDYIIPNNWSIIEEGFDPKRIKASESIFSIGNGAMGQRANFEEKYSGDSFQGSYIGGVYYPDKTKVGWWKNGYPKYFAKVLNAPNWIGINIIINNEELDLNNCKEILNFRRELNMKEGWLSRSFIAILQNGIQIKVNTKRFLSMDFDELGVIQYSITPLNSNAKITYIPYIDSNIKNADSNWDDQFWETYQSETSDHKAFLLSKTLKTNFHVCTYMYSEILLNNIKKNTAFNSKKEKKYIAHSYTNNVSINNTLSIHKFGGYTVNRNHNKEDLITIAINNLNKAKKIGFSKLLENQKKAWSTIWETADIEIKGDTKAQQGIRFNIFQLNQTYTGKDAGLNIGPKGFTGEKYGGSTYWDTEAYCLPFYMATKNQNVAENLLNYRYNHLEKAIENAQKLGFKNGAALYPMVTMNGEECHNEWEITFEEIHRNGAIAFAIYNYHRYTNDYSYIPKKGLEVLIGIARFWYQRANFSNEKKQYVILGVTGPNEYENNVNNNWYTNYLAKWCINYTIENINKIKEEYNTDYIRILNKTKLSNIEITKWKEIANNLYFPYSKDLKIYLQQDGFLDKKLTTVSDLDKSERPINQKWSWDRILRSPYIKQADVLQGMYFFEDHFSTQQIKKHFDFYEPLTVHESSLSPCVHSILAAKLNKINQAYEFYLRTSRLDLDDYNHEVEEGLHITSMAGTWLSIVEGFGGMRIKNNQLSFTTNIPEKWSSYSFKINFRNRIIQVLVNKEQTSFKLLKGNPISISNNGKIIKLVPNNLISV